MDGNSGAVVISSGSLAWAQSHSSSGDKSGGSFTLTGSASSAAYGDSMELTAGVILEDIHITINWRCFT
jgi:hypothetical protein